MSDPFRKREKLADAAAKLAAKARKGKDAQVAALREEIERLAQSDGPVLVGPFTGEVGFELLYWLPLVRWAAREFPELEGRMIVVSRGGASHWWKSFLDVTYVDILSIYEPQEYVAQKGADKQRTVKGFDEQILKRVRKSLDVRGGSALHPSLLFNFYYQVRKGDSDVFAREVRHRDGGADGLAALYDPIPHPPAPAEIAELLPDDYVAARFYFRESFPDTSENRRFALETIETLARSRPVVLLNNGLELDEHVDIAGFEPGAVITLDHLMQPDNNLHVQTVALASARAFVGTYGGLSYLAPHLGVPAVGFSSLPMHASSWHLALAQELFSGPAWAPLVTLRAEDLPLVNLVARDAPFEARFAGSRDA